MAKQNRATLGHVKGRPVNYVNGHNARKTLAERWDARDCGFRTPCWVWLLVPSDTGYGKLCVAGKRVLAHRHVYTVYRGAIPNGLDLDHLCRNRACVNPDHLEPVTRGENMRRAYAARRLSPDGCNAVEVQRAVEARAAINEKMTERQAA